MKVLLCSILLNLLLLLNLSANEYKVSVLANYGEARAIKEWQPTIDYLNKKNHLHPFVLVPIEFKDLHKLKSIIRDKKVDYVITNPVIYVKLELSSGISQILTLVK